MEQFVALNYDLVFQYFGVFVATFLQSLMLCKPVNVAAS